MPTLRERTKVKHPKRFESNAGHFNARFTLEEKKKLVLALKRYRDEDVAKIQAEFLPRRTVQEISYYLQKMRNKAQSRPRFRKEKVPIELWADTAQDLVHESTDLSYLLAEVFARIEKHELHDAKMVPEAPAWQLIYHYLVQALRCQVLPDVGQIEAGILLDLLEALAWRLRRLDITDQQRLMEAKYALLSTKVDPRYRDQICALARAALDEDLLQPTPPGASTSTPQSSTPRFSISTPQLSSSSTSVNNDIHASQQSMDVQGSQDVAVASQGVGTGNESTGSEVVGTGIQGVASGNEGTSTEVVGTGSQGTGIQGNESTGSQGVAVASQGTGSQGVASGNESTGIQGVGSGNEGAGSQGVVDGSQGTATPLLVDNTKNTAPPSLVVRAIKAPLFSINPFNIPVKYLNPKKC